METLITNSEIVNESEEIPVFLASDDIDGTESIKTSEIDETVEPKKNNSNGGDNNGGEEKEGEERPGEL